MTTNRLHRTTRLATAAVIAALMLAGCGVSSDHATPTDVQPKGVAAANGASADTADTTGVNESPAESPASSSSVVVRTDDAIDLHQSPDADSETISLPATTELGSETALLVIDQADGWVQVLVPGRPSGGTAWVATDEVELRTITTEVRVDLDERTLTVLDAGEIVLTTPVAVGAAETPTPTGRFSLTDKLDTPNDAGAYGPFALGLSGRSDVLTEFAGGDGQIGIHGTNDPSSIGNAVSHGCVRVPNDVIVQLAELLPLGTPVTVS